MSLQNATIPALSIILRACSVLTSGATSERDVRERMCACACVQSPRQCTPRTGHRCAGTGPGRRPGCTNASLGEAQDTRRFRHDTDMLNVTSVKNRSGSYGEALVRLYAMVLLQSFSCRCDGGILFPAFLLTRLSVLLIYLHASFAHYFRYCTV